MTTPNGHVNGHAAQMPETMLDDFRACRGANDPNYWLLGDRLDAWVVEMAGKLSASRIYRAAAQEVDQSVGEMRVLHETARAFDVPLRAEFEEALTHQHYRCLRYVDDRARRQAYLQLCVESADAYGGRPMPAAKLAARVRSDLGLEPPAPTLADLLARAVRAVERARDAAEDERLHARLSKLTDELDRLAAG